MACEVEEIMAEDAIGAVASSKRTRLAWRSAGLAD